MMPKYVSRFGIFLLRMSSMDPATPKTNAQINRYLSTNPSGNWLIVLSRKGDRLHQIQTIDRLRVAWGHHCRGHILAYVTANSLADPGESAVNVTCSARHAGCGGQRDKRDDQEVFYETLTAVILM